MKNRFMREVGCFTADFRGKMVLVGKRTFPVGSYFTDALNEYWKEAPDGVNSSTSGDWLIGDRISSMHLYMWNVRDDIIAGYLDDVSASKLHDSIMYILRVIRLARPFKYLDIKAETVRCNALFDSNSVTRINRYLQKKAKHALSTDRVFSRPDSSEMQRLEGEQLYLNEYISTLDYYYKLGEDMSAALDFGKGFVKHVAELEKRNESNLILCAVECLDKAPFSIWNPPFQNTASPSIEYLPLPKKQVSNNYVVGKRMTFTRFIDFLVADFFEGLHVGHYPQVCVNCKRYYLKTNARFQKYCTRVDPNDRLKRTCQAVTAAKGRAEKERHPLRYPFSSRLKTIRTHVKRGKITETQAEVAKRIAEYRYNKAMMEPEYADTMYMTEIGQDSLYEAADIKF